MSRVLGRVISNAPILKSLEGITAVTAKYPEKVSFEDAREAVSFMERETKSPTPPKELRLDALLDIGAEYSDPIVEQVKKLGDQQKALIVELEKKYGSEFNAELRLLSEFQGVDTKALDDLSKDFNFDK